jgi:hypothetical protein
MKKLLLCLAILTIFTACSSPPTQRESRRLIEWGWNTPRLQKIGAVLEQAQTLPFDGVVLDVESPGDERGLAWALFGRQSVDHAALDALVAQYADLPWGRLTDNFLRLTIFPADVGWYEDWQVIYANAEAWAHFARELGMVGIMLDVEQYGEAKLFDYNLQPDTTSLSFEAYAAQAYERGQAYMNALEAGYPGLTVMFTYALTVSLSPANPQNYGLLVPFVEGMAFASGEGTTLVDGYEHSYIFRQAEHFSHARERIRAVTPQYVALDHFENPLRVGFGLWLDPVCGAGGLPPEGCGFSPAEFTNALTQAFNYSDRYVWLYSQRVNWYTGQGIPPVWWDTLKAFRR